MQYKAPDVHHHFAEVTCSTGSITADATGCSAECSEPETGRALRMLWLGVASGRLYMENYGKKDGKLWEKDGKLWKKDGKLWKKHGELWKTTEKLWQTLTIFWWTMNLYNLSRTYMLHVWYIYLCSVIFRVNVAKYSLHGAHGWLYSWENRRALDWAICHSYVTGGSDGFETSI